VYPPGSYGGVAQLVERLTGSQEVRGFESHRLHSKSQVRGTLCPVRRRADWPTPALSTREIRLTLTCSGGCGIARPRGCPIRLGRASPCSRRAGSVQGISPRTEIAGVEAGVGAEIHGRVVAERRRRRYGHSLLGHQARCCRPQHVRRSACAGLGRHRWCSRFLSWLAIGNGPPPSVWPWADQQPMAAVRWSVAVPLRSDRWRRLRGRKPTSAPIVRLLDEASLYESSLSQEGHFGALWARRVHVLPRAWMPKVWWVRE
jgi:hypothetical protein